MMTPPIFDELRGSGRTTRMLNEAIRLARKEQKHVVVWAITAMHVKQLMQFLALLFGSTTFSYSILGNTVVKFVTESGGVIEIRSILADKEKRCIDFGDSGEFRVIGYYHDVIYLIDHYTLERIYPAVIREWLRFAE